MMDTRTTIAAILVVFGIFAPGAFAPPPPKCILTVDTTDVVLSLSPASDYCDQTSVTISSVSKGRCKNDGAKCKNSHYRYLEFLDRKCCVPIDSSTQTVTGTIQVSNADNSCTKTVTYTYANITACKCTRVGEVTYL